MSGCPCACNSGGFCGGCGHAGCGGRRRAARPAPYVPPSGGYDPPTNEYQVDVTLLVRAHSEQEARRRIANALRLEGFVIDIVGAAGIH